MKRYHQSQIQQYYDRMRDIEKEIRSDLAAVLEKHVGEKINNHEVWMVFEPEIGLLSSRWAYYLAGEDQI
jgi:hypothetical protein